MWSQRLQSYVAYLGASDPVTHPDSLRAKHQTILVSALGSVVAAESALLYSYKHVFNGFSAHLSLEEFSVLSGKLSGDELPPPASVLLLLLGTSSFSSYSLQ
jgi:hypothetical protein